MKMGEHIVGISTIFNKWLENGVKGLEENEVESYLKDHPFP